MPTGTITAIAAQAHDSQRVNIFIDGAFAIGISLATLAREQLAVGQQLDEAAWNRLEAAAHADRALHAAGRLLEIRPRSSAELRERLRRKQFPPEAIDQALARLEALGLVDDAAFSRYWVESRQHLRPRGRLALRDELRRKGVAREVIDASLAEYADDPAEEQARAMELARRVAGRYANADRSGFQRRLGGFLQRRGYSQEIIRPILGTLWEELRARQSDHPE
ncbi:MAG: RecX family transcriptional regulator [Chloroflexi bacterium OHK40]